LQKPGFRPDVEGLRALAILLVVAYHAGIPGIHGGFVGVDVFFVISGYLITAHLASELARTSVIRFREFYARRARRLLPAAAVVVVATLVGSAVVLSPLELNEASKSAAASALYASNFWFMRAASDYFAPEAGRNPFLHTWSLSVEEQFYLLWPGLLLLFWRLGGRRGLFSGIALLTVVSFASCVAVTQMRGPWAFYASPFRAWEFGIGGLASFAPRTIPLARAVSWAAFALVLGSGLFITDQIAFPGWIALAPAAGTALLLMTGRAPAGAGLFLGLPPMQLVGRLSYSFYLWHWPMLVLAAAIAPNQGLQGPILAIVLAFGFAFASHVLVENPLRFSPRLTSSALTSLVAGAVLSVCCVAAGAASFTFGHFAEALPAQRAITVAARLRSDLGRGAEKCMVAFTVSEPRLCTFGRGRKVVVLFGDSHAAQWVSPIRSIADQNGWRLVTVLKASCPTADIGEVYNIRLHRSLHECAAWRNAAINEIRALKPDLIVISNFRQSYVQGPGRNGPTNLTQPQDWAAGMGRTLTMLGASDIVVLRDTPSASFDVAICMSRHAARADLCTFDRDMALGAATYAMERQAVLAAGAAEVDLSDSFCDATRCPAIRDGLLVYRDSNHMSEGFARLLTPVLAVELPTMAAQPASTRASRLPLPEA
jgi:peptidoglycan/LPS O-acetylase OafA/YrhL